MKRANMSVCSVYLFCPHCDEPVRNAREDSDHWLVEELRAANRVCPKCLKKFALPHPKEVR